MVVEMGICCFQGGAGGGKELPVWLIGLKKQGKLTVYVIDVGNRGDLYKRY